MHNSQEIRSFLQHHLSGTALGGTFVFRRVKTVNFPQNSNQIYSKYTLPDEEPEIVSRASISREELDKSVRITCSSFRGLTDNRSMREEPSSLYGKCISYSDDTYHKFDVAGLTFELIKSEPIVPISGDLLCAFFSASSFSHTMRAPVADAWFIASDQHLRALTAIMHDRHDSLASIIAKNTPYEQYDVKLKEKLFCGNRLMTNSWLKSKLAHEQNDATFTREQSIKMYYHLRTDNASKYWVDVWAALVLIGRYGELPSDDNVPNTKGGECQRDKWHLPEGFVDKLFKLACGEESDEIIYGMFGEREKYEKEAPEIKYNEPSIVYWPDEPEVVKKWMKEQKDQKDQKEKKEKKKEKKKENDIKQSEKKENDVIKDIPELEKEPKTNVKTETPTVPKKKENYSLKILMSISWADENY
jgi:hypothetical protein